MHTTRLLPAFVALTLGAVSGCGEKEDGPGPAAQESAPPLLPVTVDRILAADSSPGEWLAHGRTFDEQRFSPLARINADNVGQLGLAWFLDLDYERGVEATPLVADGVMYTTGSWSVVYAIDAATGELLWQYDPEVPREKLQHLCCDAVNRGVALWGDKVYVGTLDGYLVALDRDTGEVAWRTATIEPGETYAITGAPRVVKGKVLIGNSGSEFGVRGYVTAYDADTGAQAWRFYTVPGNPAEPFESPAMEMAAETWQGGDWWTAGGGGTVWDSMAYDPALDLLYIGVGNGAPYSRKVRSPDGGDNLFLSSIVALRPDTGEYAWHYQTTPGDAWDFTATQHMILADIEFDGAMRQVLMQAPKNGFFYVLDRATGELISAENFVEVNWAEGIDKETGRPILAADAFYEEGPRLTIPGPAGAHNWQPMTYSPVTGLVYIPAQQLPHVYGDDPEYEFTPGFWNTGLEWALSAAPEDPEELQASGAMVNGKLIAWNPATRSADWTVERSLPWGGGLLSTAGNLVFQGMPTGEFLAYRADTGEQLWSFDAQTGVVAAPVTYAIDGEQFVAVAVGWGSIIALIGGEAIASLDMRNRSRVLVFKLGGTAELPLVVNPPEPPPDLPDMEITPELAARGKLVYYDRCNMCHGDGAISGRLQPDLRRSSRAVHERWDAIVLDGERKSLGMPGFAAAITPEDSRAIHAYVVSRARVLEARGRESVPSQD
ncbi:MAG: PQQ-dependent dehydrogenase, methanol/ethanol family [Chromatiales bacterium]|nr:MAG: PQQ-dependent dehydrogenase, methanol/ethanol family [Chromatiales bacterium]